MTEQIRAVEVDALVKRVSTMADGSFDVVFNLPEYCREQVKVLLGWQLDAVRMVVESEE